MHTVKAAIWSDVFSVNHFLEKKNSIVLYDTSGVTSKVTRQASLKRSRPMSEGKFVCKIMHTDKILNRHRPRKHKTFVLYLYNDGPTSLTLVQHCTNVIQMISVHWSTDNLRRTVFHRTEFAQCEVGISPKSHSKCKIE